ncbi:MAG: aryl-sulfate sulfotransferase [Planctomycetota bacterium]
MRTHRLLAPLRLPIVLSLLLVPLSAQSGEDPAGEGAPHGGRPAPARPAGPPPDDARAPATTDAEAEAEPAEPRGLRVREPEATPGYTLIAPLNSKAVHLLDLDGEVVHRWDTEHRPGGGLYMLENGNLLHCGHKEGVPRFHGGGIGGVIQEIDWDGKVVWEFELATDASILHHDIAPMPNGNVLAIAWETHTPAEAIARGRDEAHALKEGFWPDVVHEIRPTPPSGGEIVWTWRAWDHLVQDRDPDKPGYGAPADFPGRIDINADHRYDEEESEAERLAREETERQMAELGYTGGAEPGDDGGAGGDDADAAPKGPRESGDFLHTNSVDYLPELDLIALSTPHLCEVWVIDHSTTTEEAAGSTGGRWGRGGELLWRWGNPRMYGHGGASDQRLWYQHNPTWLPGDLEQDGLRLLVFNNGGRRPDGDYSSVEELLLPFDPERGFVRDEGMPFGPLEPAWLYSDQGNFLSKFISGAQRLPGGHTLICSGAPGRVFEVTPDGDVVWDFLSPLGGELEPSPQGGKAPPKALFRATRFAPEHPGLMGRL